MLRPCSFVAGAGVGPPYASVRWFVFGERNWCSRYPLAPWISTPSAPAAIADAAAWRKSAIVAWMSSTLSSRGTGVSCGPVAVSVSCSAEIANGPTG